MSSSSCSTTSFGTSSSAWCSTMSFGTSTTSSGTGCSTSSGSVALVLGGVCGVGFGPAFRFRSGGGL
ncbi:hypothetical protein [Lentzea sp. CA-135723]|uniref:hypothetical protein n=1 Tax=Lentzea sp. CA-135723 TaxID=3239950 RepID=UPI003D90D6B8